VTIVTSGRQEIFGEIIGGAMHLSAEGICASDVWVGLPRHYANISLDAFVVMPNHVHGIVILGAGPTGASTQAALTEVVRGFKTYSARRVNVIRGVSGTPVWQRNYYERIICDDHELQNVRRYIAENPAHWDDDSENLRVSAPFPPYPDNRASTR
jgi:REP element-mobilizing transposase RayT